MNPLLRRLIFPYIAATHFPNNCSLRGSCEISAPESRKEPRERLSALAHPNPLEPDENPPSKDMVVGNHAPRGTSRKEKSTTAALTKKEEPAATVTQGKKEAPANEVS